jgi:hypothetical protein
MVQNGVFVKKETGTVLFPFFVGAGRFELPTLAAEPPRSIERVTRETFGLPRI